MANEDVETNELCLWISEIKSTEHLIELMPLIITELQDNIEGVCLATSVYITAISEEVQLDIDYWDQYDDQWCTTTRCLLQLCPPELKTQFTEFIKNEWNII